jgi:hypothetical protein
MEFRFSYSILPLLLFSPLAVADRPAPETRYTVSSPNGTYEFTMYPTGRQEDTPSTPYGEAYRVQTDAEQISTGKDRSPLWIVTGWYSFQAFISNDGHNLVRMGPWASLPVTEQLAIVFYKDGLEIRRLFVADLIEDEESVKRSVSHYSWQARDPAFPRWLGNDHFQLCTIEGRIVTFDLSAGEIEVHFSPIGSNGRDCDLSSSFD